MNAHNKNRMKPSLFLPLGLFAVATGSLMLGCGGSSGQDPLMLQNPNGTPDRTGTTAQNNLAPSGKLPVNAIFYAQYVQTPTATGTELSTEYRYIQADKSADTLYATLPDGFEGLAGDPSVQNQKVFGARIKAGDPLGIYKSTAISLVGAVPVLPATYKSILGMQISSDGKTLYFIGVTSAPQLFSVSMSGGTAKLIDSAESFALDTGGKKLVYTKAVDGHQQMFSRAIGATAATRVLADTFEDTYPQWNRDATRIVFSSRRDGKSFDLFTVKADGTDLKQLTNTPDLNERGASYAPDNTQISYIVQSTDPAKAGLFRAALSDVTATSVQIKASPDLADETRWSGSGGRTKSPASPTTPAARKREIVKK